MEASAKCSGGTRRVCSPQPGSCRYLRTGHSGVLYLILFVCFVWDALRPWQMPSNPLRWRSTLASVVTSTLPPGGRQCCTPPQVLTQPSHIWPLSVGVSISTTGRCCWGQWLADCSCSQGWAQGLGRITKVDWSKKWKEHFQLLFIWKKCSLIPGPEQVLPLFKRISWGITVYWLSL